MLYSARCCVKLRTRNGFELAFTSACIRRRREKMISGRGESENENSKDRPDQVRTIVEWFMKHLRWEEDLFVSSDLRNERSNVAVQRRTACKCSPSSHYKILTRFRIREGWVDFKGIENLLMSKVFLSVRSFACHEFLTTLSSPHIAVLPHFSSSAVTWRGELMALNKYAISEILSLLISPFCHPSFSC